MPIYPVSDEHGEFRPFYDGLAEGELRVTCHPETGDFVWYPPEIVPGRPDLAVVWRTVSNEGSAYTFTTVVRSLLPGDHKGEVPFTVVLFEPDDAPGVRIPGVLVDADGMAPACGMRLRLKPVQAGDHLIAGFAPAG